MLMIFLYRLSGRGTELSLQNMNNIPKSFHTLQNTLGAVKKTLWINLYKWCKQSNSNQTSKTTRSSRFRNLVFCKEQQKDRRNKHKHNSASGKHANTLQLLKFAHIYSYKIYSIYKRIRRNLSKKSNNTSRWTTSSSVRFNFSLFILYKSQSLK